MTWYYKDGEQEIGPVSKAQLQELINTKRINAKTLARNESMQDWRPLGEMVRGGAAAAPPAKPPAAPESPASAPPAAHSASAPTPAVPPPKASPIPPPPALESAVCSQCGRSFPKSQVVRFDNRVICAACKPIFVQRLREGVSTPGIFKFAGFWIRFGAKFIDGLIVGVFHNVLLVPLTSMLFSGSGVSENPEELLWIAGLDRPTAGIRHRDSSQLQCLLPSFPRFS
jgi:hypothetical protein